MVALAKFFNWRDALMIVKPETFIKWRRTAFKILLGLGHGTEGFRRSYFEDAGSSAQGQLVL